MSSVTASTLFILGFLGILSLVQAFYFPNSYQRYMDENQAILRNLLAAAEHASDKEQVVNKIETGEVKPTPAHPHLDIKDTSANLVPRRDQRQFFFAPQYKRMRPCFYSPIQCLMKRSEALDA